MRFNQSLHSFPILNSPSLCVESGCRHGYHVKHVQHERWEHVCVRFGGRVTRNDVRLGLVSGNPVPGAHVTGETWLMSRWCHTTITTDQEFVAVGCRPRLARCFEWNWCCQTGWWCRVQWPHTPGTFLQHSSNPSFHIFNQECILMPGIWGYKVDILTVYDDICYDTTHSTKYLISWYDGNFIWPQKLQ